MWKELALFIALLAVVVIVVGTCSAAMRDNFGADCRLAGGEVADIHGGRGGYFCVSPDGGIIPL